MIHDLLRDPVIEYTCPMHADITAENPGNCPKCGMALVLRGVIEHELPGEHAPIHDKHAGHTASSFLRKFWIALALSIPIVLYSELPGVLIGKRMPAFPGMQFLAPILGSIVFFYAGWIFLVSAVREIRAKLPGMMTLISLAITTAYTYSMYVFAMGEEHTLFWELSTLVSIMLLGHYVEMRSTDTASRAMQELAVLLPDVAEVVVGKETKTVSLNELVVNDVFVVKPGGKVPADGVVIEGESLVNESMITGESTPVQKRLDSQMVAGTINGDGRLIVRVTRIGSDTFLAGVMRLVAGAQASKSRMQILADKAASYLTGIAIFSALTTAVVWAVVFDASASFTLGRVVAVLVVACPHALGLAVPLVVAISTSLASRNGLFIKDRLALEAARTIDMVLFDKTGTLTTGEYGIYKIIPFEREIVEGDDGGVVESQVEENILRLAASIDTASEHPVSRAIVSEARRREIELFPVTGFERLPGKGVKGTVRGLHVQVGGESLIGAKVIEQTPQVIRQEVALLAGKGQTIVYVFVDHAPIGVIALADTIRPESKEAIIALKRLGIKPVMMTGDSEEVAEWVAQDLGIADYFFRVSPHEKVERVKEYQDKGLRVAMVGDGINDAPALMQANVGIAIGAGTNVAIESAGIILAKSDPRDIAKIFKLSRLTYRKMIQNLYWATGYNVLAIPLAGGILYSQGIVLSPAVSAVLMSLSTVIVAANALLLRRNHGLL
ncbi:MAG: Copper-translocating P-type ATPase [Candidatus Wolfebacteria bacterium GW2011_GWE1_48_7]|uniref:Copper-translocating P-type ATPase n=2 Tax=Candidatus Wolfeibacteriota TaxID=1752735 RepID=A0A0G1U839_9BACT|nr:MAG: putative copper-exporting P-type ATPase B [Candidatus Wolfebacteria bacterium GW2011_GWB1_47_1]KKU42533.1 MAG: Copper-translocating P-type ATPase [Candidatus Wolfebacteria bacterium GW2011_GWB2_46_69]KKU66330.1 MAG: Copper-translocating P-type ATPase [Candidatus Wolfebacteria bacterium GW2011_GWD2_47_17]KKU74307.1 MAG: Copper-translocating P-type ATPase [Candidatus Wolfebacteria bacterium GW2011_GWA1_47_6]KKU90301.1 MAG: Copper-translocating P-type ATPase [Candidatus Wolfebacteria bacte